MVVDVGFFARESVGDNASGHRAGNLTHEHALVAAGATPDGRTLVFGARFGQLSRHAASGVMLYEDDFAIDRKPVGMNVKHAHEH